MFSSVNARNLFTLSLSQALRKRELLFLVCNGGVAPDKILKWQTSFFIPQKLLKKGRQFEGYSCLSKTASDLVQKCKKLDVEIVTFLDSHYPESLKVLYDPPLILYYQGILPKFSLTNNKYLAVVGSRHTNAYVKDYTQTVCERFVDRGGVVISGLAVGVDSAAHLGAVKSLSKTNGHSSFSDQKRGSTVAVLGCGLDFYYPPENKNLQKNIIRKGGCILTEYPLSFRPTRYTFPLRNRIIAGLSYTIFMVQGKKKSGALITVNYGLELGKDIVTFNPYDSSDFFASNHQLIFNGAKSVRTVRDFENLFTQKKSDENFNNISPNLVNIRENNFEGKGEEIVTNSMYNQPGLKQEKEETGNILEIVKLLKNKPMSLNDLVNNLKQDYLYVLSCLLDMKLQGMIKQLANQNYYLIS